MRRERRAMAMPRASQARYAVLLALLLFAVLAATPEILGALHLRNNALPKTVNGVRLLPAPSAPPRVALPPVATPIDPGQPPATLSKVSATQQAATLPPRTAGSGSWCMTLPPSTSPRSSRPGARCRPWC